MQFYVNRIGGGENKEWHESVQECSERDLQ